ncbi:MAG: class I SAM-dependent rRNA methyltransferase [Myxococcota bacterium]
MRRPGKDRGLKIAPQAMRSVLCGHPWVFRDSVLRNIDGVEPGTPMQLHDEDGRPLGWGLYEPDGAVALRIVSLAEEFTWGPDAIEARIAAALAHRETALDEGTRGACRLVHAEGDGIPGVAVDRLGEFVLVYKYARCVDAYLEPLIEILQQRLSPAGIYLQDRVKPVTPEERRPGAALMKGKNAPTDLVVEEDGLKFLVDPSAPVSPGLFLDLREGRRWVERLSKGRRVLNLFSFTGSLGMRAVRGGASDVYNIDAAARSHTRCRQNLEASGMDGQACKPLTGDVFKHLEKLRQRDERFDLVVVDPPPFSRVKGKVFSALKDWKSLMQAIVGVCAPGADVLAISNASRLSDDDLMGALGTGSLAAGRTPRLLGECGLPVDFPVPPAFTEGRYLKVKRLGLD